ncbi:G-protein coupled receptor Mth2-like [Contarinia nasturtii]|uniref:G-protein coupled receptor Mth2-like n=1 Tax=Contarinia nasturtii TaxID=265458 RepID=UPI0012D43CE7|nr:G-protein coupled receptor Mth2-like [Contarinia nasturtii]
MYRHRVYSFKWFIIQLLHSILRIEASLLVHELPCKFVDSIDISSGILHANQSITFNKMEFPENQYAKVNYILENGRPVIVEPYFRGCPCNIKPCVRLCCPYGSFVQSIRTDGSFACYNHNAAENLYSEVIYEHNQTKVVSFDQQFGFVNRICQFYFYVDDFKITEKGYLLTEDEYIDQSEYCLKITNETQMEAMQCLGKNKEYHIRYSILPYTMMLSIPMIFFTFMVYICIPELVNLLGKCLLCYLLSLFVYYIALSYVYLNAGINVAPIPCKTLAYVIYLTYFSGSLWLNAISFDLWLSFRSTIRYKKHSDQKLFHIYSCYVWISSIALTATAAVIDQVDSIPYNLKPGFGTEGCFIKGIIINLCFANSIFLVNLISENLLSKFLFLHLPITIIFFVNIMFFVLTAVKIRRVQRELNTYFHTKDNKSGKHQINFDNKKYNFTLFVRLFFVMGMTWSIDAICFVSPDSILFMISDIINTLHGVFICILFVLKRRVLNLIKQRCKILCGVESKSRSSQYSTTISKSNEIPMQEIEEN